ncbi:MAG: hypothetical protein WCF12_09235 [Propionicimonas sp.]
MRTLRTGLAAALLVAGLGLTPVSPAVTTAVATEIIAPASYCGLNWGSLPESRSGSSKATVTDVRAGRHSCYDRLVIDLKGKIKGYDVRYVNGVYTEGEGRRVPLSGDADLRIIVKAPAYDSHGHATYHPDSRTRAVSVSGFQTFKQVAFLGSFEGQTSFGVGTRARLPFRTFTLDRPGGGSRLVIDVAHRW